MANRRKQGQRHTLPHSIEAEQSVIGSVLLHPPVISQLLDLRPGQFYHPLHDNLWRLILEMARTGTQIDQVTLGNRCEAEAITWTALRAAGGIAYFSVLMNAVVTVENLDHHVKIIQDHAHRRLMAELAQRIATEALDQDSDVGRLAEDLESLASHTADVRRRKPFPCMPICDIPDEPDPRWIVEGWIQEAAYGVIVGEPKSQKSFLSINVAACLAHGSPVLGLKVPQPRRTLIYNAEDGSARIKRRYERLRLGLGLSGHNDNVILPADDTRWKLHTAAGLDRLNDTIARWKADLVFLDPLASINGGRFDENSVELLTGLLEPLQAIVRANRCALIIVHHVNKPSQTKGTPGGGSIWDRIRGSGSIRGWYETAALAEVIGYDTPKVIKLQFEGRDLLGRPISYQLEEPEGEGRGPCSFRVLDDVDDGQQRAIRNHGTLVARCMKAIQELIRHSAVPIEAKTQVMVDALKRFGSRYPIKIVKESLSGLEDTKQLLQRQREIGGVMVTCYVAE